MNACGEKYPGEKLSGERADDSIKEGRNEGGRNEGRIASNTSPMASGEGYTVKDALQLGRR